MSQQENITTPAHTQIADLKQQLAEAHAQLADAHAELNTLHCVDELSTTADLDLTKLDTFLRALELMRDDLSAMLVGPELSTSQRHRLLGSGVRRYGFIDKTSDLMDVNPGFIPQFLSPEEYKKVIRQLEVIRNLDATIRQISRIAGDLLLITGDDAFRMALTYYGAVRDASRRRVAGARELFRILQQFFRHPRPTSPEPTAAQLTRDIHALERGARDGTIVIEHHAPHLEGGTHTVVDETHKAEGHEKLIIED
jgi:hypothetical protein